MDYGRLPVPSCQLNNRVKLLKIKELIVISSKLQL